MLPQESTQHKRPLAYVGPVAGFPHYLRIVTQAAGGMNARVISIDGQTASYAVMLTREELDGLYGILSNEEGHGDLPDALQTLLAKVVTLAVAAGLAPCADTTPRPVPVPNDGRRTLLDYGLDGWTAILRPAGQFDVEQAQVRAATCPHCGTAGLIPRLFERTEDGQVVTMIFAVCPFCGTAEAL